MDPKTNFIEELIEKTVEYGKSSLELAKLKALDKILDIVSSLLAHSVVIVILFSFVLFFNLGLALWIGKIMGEIYYGFFAVAVFYCIAAIFIYFFMLKWIRKCVSNMVIKQVLK